jgi:hypothetical protein
MAINSGLLEGGPAGSGVEEGGTEATNARNYHGTPHPSTGIALFSDNNNNNDIQCGRCENPIDYCHCDDSDILFIPPPIITAIAATVTQDGEETAVPMTKEDEDDAPLVEVRVG